MSRTLFFYDDRDILQRRNLEMAPGPVEKHGVVMAPDVPSDLGRCACFAGSVVPLPGGGFRLYYSAVSREGRNVFRLAVAESEDGSHWTRPLLGQIPWEGQDTNHLWPEGMPEGSNCIQPQVLLLPDGSWRMYFWWHGHHVGRMPYVACESADGLRWRVIDLDRPTVMHPSDREIGQNGWVAGLTSASPEDRFASERRLDWWEAKRLRTNDATFVYYDEERRRFEMYSVWLLPNDPATGRYTPHDNAPRVLRTIHRRESENGLDWGDPELIITPDADDPLDIQFYHLAVQRFGEWRLGFLGHYRCWEQTMDVELCFSRDGRDWQRPLRGGWIPRGGVNDIDYFYAYPTSRVLDLGDRLLVLYDGGNFRHNQQLPPGVTQKRSAIMAATLQPGRFAGLRATERMVGSLELKPFIPAAPQVTVNASIGGCLRAELRDAFGRPLEGYELWRSEPVTGDSLAHVLRWEGGRTTDPYRYDPVRLRLEIQNGTLFSMDA